MPSTGRSSAGVARLRDDPAFYSFENVFDWRFTFRSSPGGEGGGGQILPMGPWLPKNFFSASLAYWRTVATPSAAGAPRPTSSASSSSIR